MESDRPQPHTAEALESYEKRWGPFLLAVSVAYLALAYVEILPGIPLPEWLVVLDGAFWVIFLVDYVWRLFHLAPHRRRYWREPLCLLDLVVLASFPVLLVLGSGFLGLARVARVISQIMRLVRAGAQAGRTAGATKHWATRSALRWLVPFTVVVVMLAAVYVWRAEGYHADSGIHSFWDATWWAVVTMMTVGYGETYPHTEGGRIAALILMMLGITVFTWLTAALASWFVDDDEGTVDVRKLERLADLHKKGRLTDEEFVAKKARLIGLSKLDRLAALHKQDSLTDEEFSIAKAKLGE